MFPFHNYVIYFNCVKSTRRSTAIMLGKLQQFLLPQVVAAPSRLQFVNVASIRACKCVSMPFVPPHPLLFLLLKPSCHSLRAAARPRGHSALPGPSARLAAINRSVLINLLIIDAIMCFICGTTRANVRLPNCRLGSHQASEKHLDNVVSIVDPLLLHLLVWLNVFCCGCCPFEVVSPGGNQAQRQFIHACRNCGKLKSDTFITWRSAKQ